MKKPIQLNLGCGITVCKDFINVDKSYTLQELKEKKGLMQNAVVEKGSKYVQADMTDLPFKDNFADYIETIDAVEHISFRGILKAFMEMYRVLKVGGTLTVVTPNFDNLAEIWTKEVANRPLSDEATMARYMDIMEVIYGNQANPGEFHTTPINAFFLGFLLQQSGFKEKDIIMTLYPRGTRGPDEKILKTSRWTSLQPAGMRTDMLVAIAKK